ncbi:MAG: hypothetical protein EXR70_07620 [Deltaproteobacteria bacterium]|nr:hypothetical protein [Deltaproteobacteria bacterium]
MRFKKGFATFLKALPFMTIFQLGMAASIGGGIVADWFCTSVLKFSETGRILAWVVALGSSVFFGTLVCYQQFGNTIETSRDSTRAVKEMIRNVVVLAPLLIGVALAIDPLISRQHAKSSVILWTGIVGWGALKFIFRKR